MRRSLAAAVAVLALSLAGSARAAVLLTIDVQDATINENGTGRVDVLIRNDGDTAANLAEFGFALIITPLGNTNTLEFVDPQPFGFYGDPSYIFAGNSANEDAMVPAGTVSSFMGGTDNRLVGGDSTLDGLNVVIPAMSSDFLLVRLFLTAREDSLPEVGDQFEISLRVPPATSNTFFRDANGDPSGPFQATSGVVTIANIPEPSTIALAVLALPISAWAARRRR